MRINKLIFSIILYSLHEFVIYHYGYVEVRELRQIIFRSDKVHYIRMPYVESPHLRSPSIALHYCRAHDIEYPHERNGP